jgi:hypothetical protein
MPKHLDRLGFGLLFVSSLIFGPVAMAQAVYNWNNSPNNWVNSPNNFDNSSNNWVNSPNNFNNSPNNFSATNGVYDNRGNRVGYEVHAPTGVINYFDNNGNRIGYKPANK